MTFRTDPMGGGWSTRPGDHLEYHRRPWREPHTPHLLPVLYEDDDMLVVAKPSGLQVIRGGLFNQRTVLTLLEQRHVARCQRRDATKTTASAAGGESTSAARKKGALKSSMPPAPVHRLGRGTSGVLICAQSPLAKKRLSADFAAPAASWNRRSPPGSAGDPEKGAPPLEKALEPPHRRMSKIYRGLCQGIIVEDTVVVDAPIGRVPYWGLAEGLYMAAPAGKPAHSRIRVLWRHLAAQQTLVEVDLYTGRAHQIRIHTAVAGHPLVGDPLYMPGGMPRMLPTTAGSEEGSLTSEGGELELLEDGGHARPEAALPGDCGYLLHSFRLSFHHPVTNQRMVVTAAPPPELRMPHESDEEFGPPWRELEGRE